MRNNDVDATFLKKRLEDISEGLKEGVRREVERLRAEGSPVYVARDGKVIALPPDSPLQSDTP